MRARPAWLRASLFVVCAFLGAARGAKPLRVATMNAQSMTNGAKRNKILDEMHNREIDVVAFTETRIKCAEAEHTEHAGYVQYHAACEQSQYTGVSIAVADWLDQAGCVAQESLQGGERVAWLDLDCPATLGPHPLRVVAAYGPTATGGNAGAVGAFYRQVDMAVRGHQDWVALGDWNARLAPKRPLVTGQYYGSAAVHKLTDASVKLNSHAFEKFLLRNNAVSAASFFPGKSKNYLGTVKLKGTTDQWRQIDHVVLPLAKGPGKRFWRAPRGCHTDQTLLEKPFFRATGMRLDHALLYCDLQMRGLVGTVQAKVSPGSLLAGAP